MDAVPILVCLSESIAAKVDEELIKQLKVLPTASVASESVKKGQLLLCFVNV